MAQLAELTLPATLSSTVLDATFVADGTVGVAWDECDFGGVTIKTAQANPQELGARQLWAIRGWLEGGSFVRVDASDASEFDAYGPITDGNSEAFLFEWRGVQAGTSRFTVRVAVKISDTTAAIDQLEWYGWVMSEVDGDFAITEFIYPVVNLRGFGEIRGGDSNHWEAQSRVRLLHCTSLNDDRFATFHNVSINAFSHGTNFFQVAPATKLCSGAAKLPFLTVCSGNDTGASFRHNFCLRAKRDHGHAINLNFHHISDQLNPILAAPTEAYVMLGLGTIPSAIKDHSDHTDLPPESIFSNTFGPKVVILTERFVSKSNEFWFDTCERHRDDYASLFPTPNILLNPNLSDRSRHAKQFIACWVQGQDRESERLAMANYAEFGRLLKLGLLSDYMPDFGWIAHQQTHQQGFGGGVVGERVPEEDKSDVPNWLPGMIEALELLRELGFQPQIYTNIFPFVSPSSWRDWIIAEGPKAQDRPANPTSGIVVDLSDSELFRRHIQRVTLPAIEYLELGGIHSDSRTGSTAVAWQQRGVRRHVSGGGDWSARERRQQMLDFRDRTKDSGSVPPNDFNIVSETTEEFLSDVVDAAGDSYSFLDGHMRLAEPSMDFDASGIYSLIAAGAIKTDYPEEFRDLMPPLWKICHHERFPSFKFPIDLSNKALATVDGVLTGSELADNFCLQRGLLTMVGEQNMLHTWSFDDYTPCFDVPEFKVTPEVDPAIDPGGAGLTMLAFMKQLWEAYADGYGRQWLVYGRMERSLTVDHTVSDTVTNPANAYTGMPDWALGKEIFRHYNWPHYTIGVDLVIGSDFRVGNKVFDVPRILHSVWRDPNTDRLGIVVINWSGSSPTLWEGTFDPTLYGIAGTWSIQRLTLGGTPITLGSGLSGSQAIHSAASDPGGVVYIGALAPRSVTLYEIVEP